jgi:hypothetical protein
MASSFGPSFSLLSRRFGVPLAVRLSSGLFVLVQPLVSLLPGLSVLSWRWWRSPGCFGAPPALQGEAVSRSFQCSSNLAGDGSLGWLLGCFGAPAVSTLKREALHHQATKLSTLKRRSSPPSSGESGEALDGIREHQVVLVRRYVLTRASCCEPHTGLGRVQLPPLGVRHAVDLDVVNIKSIRQAAHLVR